MSARLKRLLEEWGDSQMCYSAWLEVKSPRFKCLRETRSLHRSLNLGLILDHGQRLMQTPPHLQQTRQSKVKRDTRARIQCKEAPLLMTSTGGHTTISAECQGEPAQKACTCREHKRLIQTWIRLPSKSPAVSGMCQTLYDYELDRY